MIEKRSDTNSLESHLDDELITARCDGKRQPSKMGARHGDDFKNRAYA
ncbi:hypothetical protein [Celeribacter baekdonensis]|nr:hypothetical protein [Celeribacter baekdonensis]